MEGKRPAPVVEEQGGVKTYTLLLWDETAGKGACGLWVALGLRPRLGCRIARRLGVRLRAFSG